MPNKGLRTFSLAALPADAWSLALAAAPAGSLAEIAVTRWADGGAPQDLAPHFEFALSVAVATGDPRPGVTVDQAGQLLQDAACPASLLQGQAAAELLAAHQGRVPGWADTVSLVHINPCHLRLAEARPNKSLSAVHHAGGLGERALVLSGQGERLWADTVGDWFDPLCDTQCFGWGQMPLRDIDLRAVPRAVAAVAHHPEFAGQIDDITIGYYESKRAPMVRVRGHDGRNRWQALLTPAGVLIDWSKVADILPL